ncbi:hypothetical protein GJ496_001501 [Pomphorhynchus laevis]|nr:hypothetical protein GJ496_001501 [Pomphorhynchus laevis]
MRFRDPFYRIFRDPSTDFRDLQAISRSILQAILRSLLHAISRLRDISRPVLRPISRRLKPTVPTCYFETRSIADFETR